MTMTHLTIQVFTFVRITENTPNY